MNTSSRSMAAWLAVALLQAAIDAHAAESNPVAHEAHATTQAASLDVLIKLRPETSSGTPQKLGNQASRSQALARRTGLDVQLKSEISEHLMATHIELADRDPDQVLAALRADPQVEYVALDHRRYPHAVPNDTFLVASGTCRPRRYRR